MWGSRSSLPAARPQARLDALPATLDLSPDRGVAASYLLLTGFAVLFAGVFRFNLGPAAAATDPTVLAITNGIPLVVLGVGFLVGARGVVMLLSRREARIEGGAVRVTGRTPFGREEWSAPLSAFEGVAWRIVRRRRRRGRTRVYQVIELVHPEPSKTLPLHVRQSRHDARAEWESFARVLDLPAIDARHGDANTRGPEDLDKSLRELAAEGRTRVDWQPGTEPPAGLSWQATGDPAAGTEALIVRLHARRFPVWLYLVIAAVGAFVLYDGIADGELFAVPIGLALIAAPAAYWLAEPRRPRQLRLTRDELRLEDPMPLGQGAGPLPLAAIEEIRVIEPRSRLASPTLLIASDAGEIKTGQGLSREALEWLRSYLTAAVVEA